MKISSEILQLALVEFAFNVFIIRLETDVIRSIKIIRIFLFIIRFSLRIVWLCSLSTGRSEISLPISHRISYALCLSSKSLDVQNTHTKNVFVTPIVDQNL
jgi:hypothetical protein